MKSVEICEHSLVLSCLALTCLVEVTSAWKKRLHNNKKRFRTTLYLFHVKMARKNTLFAKILREFQISKSGKNGHFAKVVVKQYDKFGASKFKNKKVQKKHSRKAF